MFSGLYVDPFSALASWYYGAAPTASWDERYDTTVTIPSGEGHGVTFRTVEGEDAMGPICLPEVAVVSSNGTAAGLLFLNDHVMKIHGEKYGVKGVESLLVALGSPVPDEAHGRRPTSVTLHIRRECRTTVQLQLARAKPLGLAAKLGLCSPPSPSRPMLKFVGVELTEPTEREGLCDFDAEDDDAKPFGLELIDGAHLSPVAVDQGNAMPWGGSPVYVRSLVRGSEAAKSHAIGVGHRLEQVDGVDILCAAKAIELMAAAIQARRAATLLFARKDTADTFRHLLGAVEAHGDGSPVQLDKPDLRALAMRD